MSKKNIIISGASQNNLKKIDVKVSLDEITVVTGVSGSGKTTLALDTIYAEGQRRYVETFSPYARQFLERIDKPNVSKIEGIVPAVAISQANVVKTSRSTVGSMTELVDYLKVFFYKRAKLYCRGCNSLIKADSVKTIFEEIIGKYKIKNNLRIYIYFFIEKPKGIEKNQIENFLSEQGYHRYVLLEKKIEVTQDRVEFKRENYTRIKNSIETALKMGKGFVKISVEDRLNKKFSTNFFNNKLICQSCNISYSNPSASSFSFNSPVGACEECKGFGRVIGIDPNLIIHDDNLSIREGVIKPWQTPNYRDSQEDLVEYSLKKGIDIDLPWYKLSSAEKEWVFSGDNKWLSWKKSWPGHWYGVNRFFKWLEKKSYKMHIRVLLSKYRSYDICPKCNGGRLKPESLLWRIGKSKLDIDQKKNKYNKNMMDIMSMSAKQCFDFFENYTDSYELNKADQILLLEIKKRLDYLNKVGLGYLTLDRQSRTLSGGELQRINLTTALGTALTNTLFVLDEPSIGLHPKNIDQIFKIIKDLKKNGNSVLMVEHDPKIILSSDRIIDIGPSSGTEGGEIIFSGEVRKIFNNNKSITSQYLTGRKKIAIDMYKESSEKKDFLFKLTKAKKNNLKEISFNLPINTLICMTGVSGSGKSTLLNNIVYESFNKNNNQNRDFGDYNRIVFNKKIGTTIFVDQNKIGLSVRSTPISYIGIYDEIRKLFSKAYLSTLRGYKPGTFSFNSGVGRCQTCMGNGFEIIEMQFLADIHVNCVDCKGKRFSPEVLEVFIELNKKKYNISDILNLSVAEAKKLFVKNHKINNGLDSLIKVGLEYIKIGQPITKLSTGEAQRIKLSKYLNEANKIESKKILFLLDEPTTGLHFNEISKLIKTLYELIKKGHSIIAIEHNSDFILNSQWVVDLGPAGGEGGGKLLFNNTLKRFLKEKKNLTSESLIEYLDKDKFIAKTKEKKKDSFNKIEKNIEIVNASENNLKNINLSIPLGKFNVITGVSGSGKSTLAFDIIFGEGQRRFLESINAFSRQFIQTPKKPDVDAIYGIPPTVAIEQRTSRGGSKSTVATVTEIYHYLRLLFLKLGVQYCPICNTKTVKQSKDEIYEQIKKVFYSKKIQILAPIVSNRKGIYEDLARWALKNNYNSLVIDNKFVETSKFKRLNRFVEHNISINLCTLDLGKCENILLKDKIDKALELGNGIIEVVEYSSENKVNIKKQKKIFSMSRVCPSCFKNFDDLDPRLFSFNSKHGWCKECKGLGYLTEDYDGELFEKNDNSTFFKKICPKCNGDRLNEVALAVFFKGKNLSKINSMTIIESLDFFKKINLTEYEKIVCQDILKEIIERLSFLIDVGLSYLTLGREMSSLSGGESQRIRLASQLGSNLQGVCYVLDEPTIGLHPKDNETLLNSLESLKNKGNTLLVVEHDGDTIKRADNIIDIGPSAGNLGGEIIFQGNYSSLLRNKKSLTGTYLRRENEAPTFKKKKNNKFFEIIQGELNNLKKVNVNLMYNSLNVVTGVSGSGKSTLVRKILFENIRYLLKENSSNFYGCKKITNWSGIKRVLEVDQSPIGRTSRSCPATYIGFYDEIRKLFAQTHEAQRRGYSASRFSFNNHEGRCAECDGQGIKKIEMSFLPDVKVKCESCNGLRFNEETLSVLYLGKSIGEVLQMTVNDALSFFQSHNKLKNCLKFMKEIGLGYLTLGQHSSTLSGGEAQRIKLVLELIKSNIYDVTKNKSESSNTLYILDEPTVGLHMSDVKKLIEMLRKLIQADHTIVCIEHNVEFWLNSDWIIDLGPSGGEKGGQVIGQGSPIEIANLKESFTGEVLSKRINV